MHVMIKSYLSYVSCIIIHMYMYMIEGAYSKRYIEERRKERGTDA